MDYHELTVNQIKYIADAMDVISKIYPGHQMKYSAYRDPEGYEWVEGFIYVAGITQEDTSLLNEKIRTNNAESELHIITEPWYDWNDHLPGQK